MAEGFSAWGGRLAMMSGRWVPALTPEMKSLSASPWFSRRMPSARRSLPPVTTMMASVCRSGLLGVAGQAGDEDDEAGEPEEGQQQQETAGGAS